jgi:hypothetical protein
MTSPHDVTGLKAGVYHKRILRRRLLVRWLDMHEHICDARVALLDCRLYSMRDLMPFVHGNVSVHADV